MKLGLIGLGRMGSNLALNMKDKGIEVIGYNRSVEAMRAIEEEGIKTVESVEELVKMLPRPRLLWLMIPAGKATDDMITTLTPLLNVGDIVIDGGNSNFNDTIRRHDTLLKQGIHLVDCGTSGGINGARNGACLMVGGDEEVVKAIEKVFELIAVENGYGYMGASGSGHFVKMVHNGIEYGMMQAIGEGFDLLNASAFNLNFQKVARVWANGSIIEGLLINNVHDAFAKDKKLDLIEGRVDDSGEGQWMIETALKHKVAVPVIAQSLFARYKSKDDLKFAEKVVAAMRNEFGGHKVYKK